MIKFYNEFEISKPLESQLNKLLCNSFGNDFYEQRTYFKQLPHYRLIAFEYENVVAQLAIDYRVMNLNKVPINVFGIIDLCVDENYRGKGIAKKLLAELEHLAKKNKQKIDFLLLVTEEKDFYQKLNFKVADVKKSWLKINKHKNYGIANEKINDAFIMYKPISDKKWIDGNLDYLGYMY